MLLLVRIDDRLLHGQVITAWVPYLKADSLLVASDEVYNNSLMRDFITSLGHQGLRVSVKRVRDVCMDIRTGALAKERLIIILSSIEDAMRIYEDGVRFTSLNIGNIHHEIDGRKLSPSVIINREDERILERLRALGVTIDIRDLPTRAAVPFEPSDDGHD